jgi:hypothetical protein
VGVQQGSELTLDGAALLGNREIGLFVATESTAAITEALIAHTEPRADGTTGWGVKVQSGARLVGQGLRLHDNVSDGLVASDVGSEITLETSWISETQMANGILGFGLRAQEEARAHIRRSFVSDCHTVGVLGADGGVQVTVEETWVTGTRPFAAGLNGRGVMANDGAVVDVLGALISDNEQVGIHFIDSGGSVVRTLIEGTKGGALSIGDGLLVMASTVEADRVISRENARAGVVFDKSDGELSRSLITQNAIGLVNQGAPGATIAQDNVIEGNDLEWSVDGDLQVPDEAMELPDIPVIN